MITSETQSLHREAKDLKEVIKRAESMVIVSVDSIRLHSIPEMQNVVDVLETLFEPLHIAGKKAEALENTLYRGYIENNNRCVVIATDEDLS